MLFMLPFITLCHVKSKSETWTVPSLLLPLQSPIPAASSRALGDETWIFGCKESILLYWTLRVFWDHQEREQNPQGLGWMKWIPDFHSVCVNSLLTLQGGFQMSGHNHHVWWVAAPQEEAIMLTQRHLSGVNSVTGTLWPPRPPLCSMQVQLPQPMPEQEMPPPCAKPAMRCSCPAAGLAEREG